MAWVLKGRLVCWYEVICPCLLFKAASSPLPPPITIHLQACGRDGLGVGTASTNSHCLSWHVAAWAPADTLAHPCSTFKAASTALPPLPPPYTKCFMVAVLLGLHMVVTHSVAPPMVAS